MIFKQLLFSVFLLFLSACIVVAEEYRITEVFPVYSYQEQSTISQRCYIDRVPIRSHREHRDGSGALTGAVLGGVIGNRLDSGDRTAGTIIGAIIGGALGSNHSSRTHTEYERQRVCERIRVSEPVAVLEYYVVYYEKYGRIHSFETTHHYNVGDRIVR